MADNGKINIRKLYREACIRFGIGEGEFIRCYNDAATTLVEKYGRRTTAPDDGEVRIRGIGDTSALSEHYALAVLSGIRYRLTGDSAAREEFLVLSDEAHISILRERNRGKRIRGWAF